MDHLRRPDLDGIWIHLDCDAVDDAVMPAVDYRLPGGLSWDELEALLRVATRSRRLVGLDITIFNPALDADGSIASSIVSHLTKGLSLRGPDGRDANSTV
jgi:arginase